MFALNDVELFAFDLDGVIADTELLHKESKLRMLRRFGIDGNPDMEGYVGLPNAKYWSEMKDLYPQVAGTLEELETMQFAGILALLEEKRFRPSDGLVPLLERLAERGVKRGLYSSSVRFYVDDVLRFFNLERFFPIVIGGDEVPRRKPFPDGYERVAALAGVSPDRAVAIEDSTAGVRAAKAAGLRAIGYRNPTSGNQDLSEADWIVDGLGEVVRRLDAIG